jgi:hypothetical protein
VDIPEISWLIQEKHVEKRGHFLSLWTHTMVGGRPAGHPGVPGRLHEPAMNAARMCSVLTFYTEQPGLPKHFSEQAADENDMHREEQHDFEEKGRFAPQRP